MKTQRIKKVQSLLKQKQVDSFLITNPYNIAYLTDFKSLAPSEREAFVLITQKNVYLFSDGRYETKIQISNSKSQNKTLTLIQFKLLTAQYNFIYHLKEIIEKDNIQSLAFESEDLKWTEYTLIQKKINTRFVPLDKVIITMRAIKDDDELINIKKACEIGDVCLKELIPHIKIGKSEKEISFLLETMIRTKGYELAFDPIVAFDKNSSIPHHNTKMGEGIVKNSSLILIDFGVKHNGYCSDITRMFFMNSISDAQKRTYALLKNAEQNTIQQLVVGKKLSEVDLFCREQITGNATYSHSTGHGVGLEIHEYPKVSTFSADTIQMNTVFTIEPGIYYAGKWGMRIEDTVCADSFGKIQVLTQVSKEFTLL